MTKTTLDVTDLFSVLDFAGVQKRLLALPGVGAVEMTAASGSVTVTYDPGRTDPATIAAKINACGFHCRGETVPNHFCLPDRKVVPPGNPKSPSAVAAKDPHASHAGMTPAARPGCRPARPRTRWRMRWGTGPAWTCRAWSPTCATGSSSR